MRLGILWGQGDAAAVALGGREGAVVVIIEVRGQGQRQLGRRWWSRFFGELAHVQPYEAAGQRSIGSADHPVVLDVCGIFGPPLLGTGKVASVFMVQRPQPMQSRVVRWGP